MDYLYIVIALIAIFAECSSNVDTRNLFKKFGLALIVFGALVNLSGNDNFLIEWGSLSYIAADIWGKVRGKGCLRRL